MVVLKGGSQTIAEGLDCLHFCAGLVLHDVSG